MATIRHWSTNVAGFKAFCSKAGSVDATALRYFTDFQVPALCSASSPFFCSLQGDHDR
jgi:hypothetical protein